MEAFPDIKEGKSYRLTPLIYKSFQRKWRVRLIFHGRPRYRDPDIKPRNILYILGMTIFYDLVIAAIGVLAGALLTTNIPRISKSVRARRSAFELTMLALWRKHTTLGQKIGRMEAILALAKDGLGKYTAWDNL